MKIVTIANIHGRPMQQYHGYHQILAENGNHKRIKSLTDPYDNGRQEYLVNAFDYSFMNAKPLLTKKEYIKLLVLCETKLYG